MRVNVRFALSVALLCVPMAAAIALAAWFLLHDVPGIVEAERKAVVLQYRERLDEIRDDAARWRTCDPAHSNLWVRAQPRSKEAWGFFELPAAEGEGTVLWRKAGGERFETRIETIPVTDYRTILVAWACAGSLFLLVLTLWAIRFFVRYARERDDFVGATAHDLTTPLVALRRLVGRDDAEAKAVVERMVMLVKNLTDFLRLGGRRPAPVVTTFDLRRVFDEAYGSFREDYRWTMDGRDIAVEGPAEVPVEADETMTMQILWNLLANDLKYAAPYGPVRVRFSVGEGAVRVEFADVGTGLTAHERRRIFRRYYRAKSVLRSGKGGFGIGLCTAREFARAMGGDLTVAPNEPKGCVFTLVLRGKNGGNS